VLALALVRVNVRPRARLRLDPHAHVLVLAPSAMRVLQRAQREIRARVTVRLAIPLRATLPVLRTTRLHVPAKGARQRSSSEIRARPYVRGALLTAALEVLVRACALPATSLDAQLLVLAVMSLHASAVVQKTSLHVRPHAMVATPLLAHVQEEVRVPMRVQMEISVPAYARPATRPDAKPPAPLARPPRHAPAPLPVDALIRAEAHAWPQPPSKLGVQVDAQLARDGQVEAPVHSSRFAQRNSANTSASTTAIAYPSTSIRKRMSASCHPHQPPVLM